jgi:NADH:ubiquinone oxidoreductase subunit 4 (subunit M)
MFSTGGETKLPVPSLTGNITLAVIVVSILILGVYPGWLIDIIVKFISL